MNLDAFWPLIEQMRSHGGDRKQQVESLTQILMAMPLEAIFDYQRHYDMLHSQAYRTDLWNTASIIGAGYSDDCFTDFRAWLIAQGRSVYEVVLCDPEVLTEAVALESRYETMWEAFGYIGADAYERRTNTTHGIPLALPSIPLIRNHPLTENEEELRQLYPRLWAKFGKVTGDPFGRAEDFP